MKKKAVKAKKKNPDWIIGYAAREGYGSKRDYARAHAVYKNKTEAQAKALFKAYMNQEAERGHNAQNPFLSKIVCSAKVNIEIVLS